MKFSLNRLVFVVGAFILALMAIDGLIQLNAAASSEFGTGHSAWVAADSAAALFMIGLVAGMVLGIGIFFGYLVYREKKYANENEGLDELLEELAREEEDDALFVEDNQSEERAEKLDPWERPSDWWKSSDEEY